jgi:gamma-glutamyl phosphate reductase
LVAVVVAVIVVMVVDNTINGIATYVSQYSKVSIVTSYWLKCPRFVHQLGKAITPFSQTFRLSLRSTQNYLHWVPRSIPSSKAAGA